MKTTKMSLQNLAGKLTRQEMKQVLGGGYAAIRHEGYCSWHSFSFTVNLPSGKKTITNRNCSGVGGGGYINVYDDAARREFARKCSCEGHGNGVCACVARW